MKKISIAILVLVVALVSCKKTPEVNLKYVDVERDLITVGMTTATVQCDYDYIATLKKAYFYYGEGANEADMNAAEMRVVQHTLYVDLTGLRANTTYSYYYEFHNGFNSMRTALKTFKTEASPAGVTMPTVVTASVTEITTNSAKSGGEVTNDGGAQVTERGICWSTNVNPTISDNHVAVGSGAGSFSTVVSGLQTSTTYHVRAYATNEAGTAYGLDKEFTTLSGGGSGIPEGVINGLFTINENGDQVYFSKGNLQYQASTNTWRFAEKQWDFVGDSTWGTVMEDGIKCDNSLISSTYNGWIDLFGWGTSGYNHGAQKYQPWETFTNSDGFWAYGMSDNNLYDQTGKADWGYNPINNGGNQENLWRTLTFREFEYLLDIRTTNSGIRWVKAEVDGCMGFLVLPDDWDISYYDLSNAQEFNCTYQDNTITEADWCLLESKGAVFLPANGYRIRTEISGMSPVIGGMFYCNYWTASCYEESSVYARVFASTGNSWPFPDAIGWPRYVGCSVRLVQDANKTIKQ